MAALQREPFIAGIEFLDEEVRSGPEAAKNAAARREQQIGADVLELYCRFRAKDEPNMPQKIWVELLEKTIPKLKVGHNERTNACCGVLWAGSCGVVDGYFVWCPLQTTSTLVQSAINRSPFLALRAKPALPSVYARSQDHVDSVPWQC